MNYRFLLLITTLLWMPAIYSEELVDAGAEIQVTNAPDDQAIENRLSDILNVIESYEDVEVTVDSGVVILSGNVSSARARRDLVALASRVEGVIYVQNQLNELMDISTRVQPTTQKIEAMLSSLIRSLPIFLVAIITIIFFWLLGRWVGNRSAWLSRIGLSELATDLGGRIIRILIVGIGFLIALQILDATALVGALLGVAGVFGLAVGFAFRNIVENYLAGVLLSARNPFKIGDSIQIAEFTGNVVRLTSRDTVLMTADGNHLRIPNSTMITSVMINYTRNPLRRFEFTLAISAEIDLIKARRLGLGILQNMQGLLAEPGPQVLIADIRENIVDLHFMAWINQHESDFAKARSEAIRLIKIGFDEAGITFHQPVHRLQLINDETNLEPEPANALPETESTLPNVSAEASTVDIATDPTMSRQVAHELNTSDEENLLK